MDNLTWEECEKVNKILRLFKGRILTEEEVRRMKVSSLGGKKSSGWLKAADTQTGETVVFENAGETVQSDKYPGFDGKPKTNHNFKVTYKDTVMSMTVNQTSLRNLATKWGDDTEDWVGKKATITKQMGPNGITWIYLDAI